ncbi:hypothetical protein E4U21_001007 [Claviceps maximensis]|nr:hypothetical protein E4U21_001007 [Claviceps maximensis]
MPASEQQMPREPAPMSVAVPESRASVEQPRPAEPMSADPMSLRGGGEGENLVKISIAFNVSGELWS